MHAMNDYQQRTDLDLVQEAPGNTSPYQKRNKASYCIGSVLLSLSVCVDHHYFSSVASGLSFEVGILHLARLGP